MHQLAEINILMCWTNLGVGVLQDELFPMENRLGLAGKPEGAYGAHFQRA